MLQANRVLAPIAALLAALCLQTLAIAPTATARPLITGVTNIDSDERAAFEKTRATGARFVRLQLKWQGLLPAEEPAQWNPEDPSDPNYDWTSADEEAINAVKAGLIPVFQIGGPPPWGERCSAPSSLPAAICDPDPTALRNLATAAARHFDGDVPGVPRVRYWQVLNEPNLSLFFFPQFSAAGKAVSADLYRRLINAAYAGVKAADPSDLVVAGGLGPIAVPPWTIGPMRFAREMLCMKGHRAPRPTRNDCEGGVHFDIFAIQPYTTGGPTHEGGVNDIELGDLGKLQELLRAADRAGRIKGRFKHTPLWITEFSWDSKPPDPGGLPMSTLTRWTAEALHVAWRAGVSNFFWFSLTDHSPEPSRAFSETLQSGLYFWGSPVSAARPKRSLQAFRFPFVAYQRNDSLRFWGRTPTSEAGRVSIQVLSGKRWRPIHVAHAAMSGIFRGSVRTGYGRGRRGFVRAVCAGQRSAGFSMRPVPDFYHPPLGAPSGPGGAARAAPPIGIP